jgi:hypothetical protein
MNDDSTPSNPAQPRPAFRLPPIRLADNGKVRLGGQGPVFRADAIKDTGKVRLGAQGPTFR